MVFENVTAFESEFLAIGAVKIHKTKAIHGDSRELAEMMGEVTGMYSSLLENSVCILLLIRSTVQK